MLEQADAVFAGKVIGINKAQVRLRNDEQGQPLYGEGQAVLFDVTAIWKGISQSQVIVGAGDSMCDPIFRVGESYLVYASGPLAELSTNDDIPIDLALKDDLLPLGRVARPAQQVSLTLPGEPFPQESAEGQSTSLLATYQEPIKFQYIVGAVVLLAMLATIGFLAVSRRKAQFS
jgi:hypothetical protein